MVQDSVKEREERDKKHEILFNLAKEAGDSALAACVPVPMVVCEHANPLDDSSALVKAWNVPSGVCGFAWVVVRPGNCSFALWLKKHKGAARGYHGGMQLWTHAGGQSIEKKEAYARAFADVVRASGIDAYLDSRED
jgi:hypothetical protein